MKFLDLPARTCNELAQLPVSDLEHLPAILSVIEQESLLGAVVVAHPEFLRCACECIDVPEHECLNLWQQLMHIAAMYILGDNDPEERRIANEYDLFISPSALRSF